MQSHNMQFAKTGYTETIVIPAELDERTLNDLASRLEHILDNKPTLIELECSRLDPVTPGHISSLRIVCAKCTEAGITVRLASVSQSLESFLRLFNLYDTLVGADSPNSKPSQPRQPKSEKSRPSLRLQVRPTIDEIYAASEKLRCFLRGLNTIA